MIESVNLSDGGGGVCFFVKSSIIIVLLVLLVFFCSQRLNRSRSRKFMYRRSKTPLQAPY